MSKWHRTLFVETIGPDPELTTPLARFRTLEQNPNLTVLRLQFPSWRWPDAEFIDRERCRIVREFVNGPGAGQFENPIQWFYDPMAVTAFGGKMGECLTVYDCMDELSQFKGAPPEIRDREAELLARADVVFTGGRRLYESKSRYHDNCHFYGCGVDWEHFGKAREAQTIVPPEIESLPKPVFGFFGVVDERMDYELVSKVADANPEGSVVIVGPSIKVDPQNLPRRSNLHWLGQRAYAELPACCKGFDVCLMPFALNEATEYINPTKALEYMATGRPVISTAITDVMRNFGDVIKVAKSHEEFVALCRAAVEDPDMAAINLGLQKARENSWESIVSQIENNMQDALIRAQTAKLAI